MKPGIGYDPISHKRLHDKAIQNFKIDDTTETAELKKIIESTNMGMKRSPNNSSYKISSVS